MAYHMELEKHEESGAWRIRPGPYVREEVQPLDERRMIFVPAVPSSGTSMVAGVLHHLGVNMGNCASNRLAKRRGYEQFEDLDVSMFGWKPDGSGDSLMGQRFRFLEYMNYRYMTQEGRLGVKSLPTVWMYNQRVEAWPIDVLDVRRPLMTALEKDINRLATRKERTPEWTPFTGPQVMARYGGVAAMHWARERLIEFHPPKLTVEYDEFRKDAPTWIEKIVEVFELNVNDFQMTSALLSVKR